MKVKELIKLLQTYKPNEEIYMSRDEEGNGFQDIYETIYTEDENGERFLTIYPGKKYLNN